MPDKPRIIDLADARRQREAPALAEILPWIEEIEDALETMTRADVETRAELEALLTELEASIPPDGKP